MARSTFLSQKCEKLTVSEHFWKMRCQKSVRRCGAKHISKSKCTQHTMFGPLLEVEKSKKCTPLWREAHFQEKSVKNLQVRNTIGRSDVVFRGKHRGLCTLSKCAKRVSFVAVSTKTTTFHSIPLHSIPLHYYTLHYTTLHITALHYTTPHCATLRYTTLH